jgi:negative regulator of flagellin synthesis FlgM
MRRILALTRESDQARIEHIDRIKQVMEGETYDVSGRKVGDALIKEVLTDAVLAVL